ncbi:hypothetical protein CCMA1212_005196 [Trichoderma ghanense]|uniref:Heterokaryon incompatibility domain-containing protein n=1 Tax=Trichoderma ghanense TaxID=65468 RepID=A0ABY2H5Z5_9HYPO
MGHTNSVTPLECDGATLGMTQNCMDALHWLRSTDDLTFWIDGIGIGQTCTSKRSAHVVLMRDIYMQAVEAVCLGRRRGEQKGH